MKPDKVFGLTLIFLMLAASTASPVHAGWGMMDTLSADSNLRHYSLTEDAVRKSEIRFCYETNDPKSFPRENLLQEIPAALGVWTNELEKLGALPIALKAVSCSDPALDLKVEIEPDPKSALSSYEYATLLTQGSAWHAYSVVRINSGFQQVSKTSPGIPPAKPVDFSSFLRPGESLKDAMNDVSYTHPMTVLGFAMSRELGYLESYFNTYKTLIHEFGHSFGLCDQYEGASHCDATYRMQTQATSHSVMRDSDGFYLMDDDRAGLKALYERFTQ